MHAGNISTGNTMPLTVPKAARGSETPGLRASRRGTMRFSAALIPAFRISARARGTAACRSLLQREIEGPAFARSRSRRAVRQERVRQPPSPLPSRMHWQALPASCPAKKDSASRVTAMAKSCSATSTAESVPIRLAAVKYPVITAHSPVTGRKAASSRRAPSVRLSPIQARAMPGARVNRRRATVPLHRRL